MGGTTAKICLIDDFQPQTSRAFEVARIYRFKKGSGLPLRIPVIEMVEIGAGGGSIARVDRLKRITVGPDSAGADPGPRLLRPRRQRRRPSPMPTCCSAASTRPGFSGGRMPLDSDAAERGGAARPSRRRSTWRSPLAAFGVSEIVDENMANAARVHAIESGKDARGRTLVAFGGAAPLHAARMADKLGLDRVLVPSNAGVGSAVGFLRAPIAYEIVRSQLQRLDRVRRRGGQCAAGGDARRGRSRSCGAATAKAPLTETRSAFMRYRGQGHEIAVPLPVRAYREEDAGELLRRLRGGLSPPLQPGHPGVEVEVLSWVLLLSGPVPVDDGDVPPEPPRYTPQPARRRRCSTPTPPISSRSRSTSAPRWCPARSSPAPRSSSRTRPRRSSAAPSTPASTPTAISNSPAQEVPSVCNAYPTSSAALCQTVRERGAERVPRRAPSAIWTAPSRGRT